MGPVTLFSKPTLHLYLRTRLDGAIATMQATPLSSFADCTVQALGETISKRYGLPLPQVNTKVKEDQRVSLTATGWTVHLRIRTVAEHELLEHQPDELILRDWPFAILDSDRLQLNWPFHKVATEEEIRQKVQEDLNHLHTYVLAAGRQVDEYNKAMEDAIQKESASLQKKLEDQDRMRKALSDL